MSKTLTFLLYITLVSAVDHCRDQLPLQPTGTCSLQQTMYNEGECLCCYNDTHNIPTIGIGFNLQNSNAADVLAKYGLKLADVLQDCADKTTKHCLTQAAVEEIFNTLSYPDAERCADSFAPGLPPVKRAAIIDMALMGCTKLNGFVKMQAALKKRDWKTAGAELKDSKWCGQVGPNRCGSDYNCIVDDTSSTTSTSTSKPTPGCNAETCGTYTFSCSSNPDCTCFQRQDGSAFCGISDSCYTVSDCSLCPANTVCLISTCCPGLTCESLADHDPCADPPTNRISQWNKPAILSRPVCKEDKDCPLGTACKLHSVGRFCV